MRFCSTFVRSLFKMHVKVSYLAIGLIVDPIFHLHSYVLCWNSDCLFAQAHLSLTLHNWDSLRENVSSRVCEQLRNRPGCAFSQSDQCLCYSLI